MRVRHPLPPEASPGKACQVENPRTKHAIQTLYAFTCIGPGAQSALGNNVPATQHRTWTEVNSFQAFKVDVLSTAGDRPEPEKALRSSVDTDGARGDGQGA